MEPTGDEDDLTKIVLGKATPKAQKRKAEVLENPAQQQLRYVRQTSITNWYTPTGNPVAREQWQFAGEREPVGIPPRAIPGRGPDLFEVSGEDAEYSVTLKDGGAMAGELTLLWDEFHGVYWVNNIRVKSAYRRQGLATRLLKAACDEHGTIYFSLQDSSEDTDVDTRHLTPDGYALARAAEKNPALKIKLALPNDLGGGDDGDDNDGYDGGYDDVPTTTRTGEGETIRNFTEEEDLTSRAREDTTTTTQADPTTAGQDDTTTRGETGDRTSGDTFV